MFTTGEDENLELEVRGPSPCQWAPIYGGETCGSTSPSTPILALDGIYSGLNPYVGIFPP
jgi:hypothetical protein